MNRYKTIDQLLEENGNLAAAVSILIQGCLDKNRSAILDWDRIRQWDSKKYKEMCEETEDDSC